MTTQTSGDDCRESGEGETMREQFEAWIVSMPRYTEGDIKKRADGQYEYMETEWCFRAWVASREAMKIEIPDPACRYADDSHKAYSRKQVVNMLAELGVHIVEEEI
ncbi:hypothetical protein AC790_13425 [Pantoea sp. RIT-PI-b]|uniref:hypothetical protein n=1 Tax=Pantoea sp. RIT-PI-b TaxID=1681195 RepID=UPI000675C36F|nr:hypothetical protein [Pantoea sp. RIT-PI-b]KNC11564.1 hypothetical protein AC790_13425 [Pantoea sp. RIT-PI-b]